LILECIHLENLAAIAKPEDIGKAGQFGNVLSEKV
jgi:hypothetical protein